MSGQSTRRPGELAFVIMLGILSAFALWQAYGISGLTGLSEPGVFPMLAAATMLLSSIIILRDTLRTKRSGKGARQTPSDVLWRDIMPVRLLVTLAMVAIYLYVMPWLGFVLSSGMFLFACFAYLWRKSLLISLILAIGSLAVVYFLFRVVFEVVLPQGTLIPAGVF